MGLNTTCQNSTAGSHTVVKAGVGYTVANILVKGINFLSLPIFSRLLTTEEFGYYNIFIAVDAVAYCIVGFALHSSVQSAQQRYGSSTNKYISSISILYPLSFFGLALIVFVFGNQISLSLQLDKTAILFGLLSGLGSAAVLLYNSVVALDYSYKKYLIVALFNSAGNVVLSLVLMLTVFQTNKLWGRLLGAAISSGVLAIGIIVSFWIKEHPHFNAEYWRWGLRYSLPIIANGLSQVILAQFNKVILMALVGATAAGLFGLATNIQSILNVITASIGTVWNTWFYSVVTSNKKAISARASNLIDLFAFLTVSMLITCPEMILILGGRPYEDSFSVAIPLILSAFFIYCYNLVVSMEYFSGRTIFVPVGTLLAALINVVFCNILIPYYGWIAAGYVTLASYIIYFIFHWYIASKLASFQILPFKGLMIAFIAILSAAFIASVFRSAPLVRYIFLGFFVLVFIMSYKKMKGRKE